VKEREKWYTRTLISYGTNFKYLRSGSTKTLKWFDSGHKMTHSLQKGPSPEDHVDPQNDHLNSTSKY